MKNIINAHPKIFYPLVVTLIVSSMLAFPAFAQNSNFSSQTIDRTNDNLFSAVGTWFSQLLSKDSLTANIFITITSVDAFPTRSEALITWNASNLATGRVYYDTLSPIIISSSTPSTEASLFGNYANSKASLRYLKASTTYYYKVIIEDKSGNVAISKELSFTTEE